MLNKVLKAKGEKTLVVVGYDSAGNVLAQPQEFGEVVTLTPDELQQRFSVAYEAPKTLSVAQGWEKIGRSHGF